MQEIVWDFQISRLWDATELGLSSILLPVFVLFGVYFAIYFLRRAFSTLGEALRGMFKW